jgi:hypothetical protein
MKQYGRKLACLTVAALFAVTAACDRTPTGGADHTLGRVDIIDRGLTDRPVVASWTPTQGWTGALPSIVMSTERQRVSLGVRMYSADGTERELSRTGEYSARWSLAPNAATGIIVNDDSRGDRFHGDHIHIYGNAVGTTQIQFLLWHGDHADGATASIPIAVVD